MKKILFTLLLVASITRVSAQLLNFQDSANDVVNNMMKQLNLLTNSAIDRGDFITEARLKEAGIMLDGIKYTVSNERIKTLDQLDRERLDILKGIDQMLAGRLPSVYELRNLTAIIAANAQNIVNSINPAILVEKKFHIYAINGISQSYKRSGLYKISFIGNNFNDHEIENFVLINNQPMTLRQGNNIFEMYVEIPPSVIQPHFKDTLAARIPFRIISTRKQKGFLRKEKVDTVVNFANTILLHPKLPFTYELVEVVQKSGWSAPIVGTFKEMDTTPKKTVTITAGISDGNVIDEATTVFYDPAPERKIILDKKCPPKIKIPLDAHSSDIGVHFAGPSQTIVESNKAPEPDPACVKGQEKKLAKIGYWVNDPVYSFENREVRRQYYCTERKRIWVEVHYKKPLLLEPEKIKRKFAADVSGYLNYGSYESELFSQNYLSYILKLKTFYGEEIFVNPATPGTDWLKVNMQSQNAYKTLTVTLNPPL